MRRRTPLSLILALVLALPVGLRGQEMPMAAHDGGLMAYVAVDEFEVGSGAERPVALDGLGWVGGDFQRVWMKIWGERSTRESAAHLEGQLLYGRVIAPFWDVQVGVALEARHADSPWRTRGLGVVALQGLAPYWFEVESALLVSQDGDVSARFQATYDLFLGQRLTFEPEVELDLAIRDVAEFDVGRGLSAVELGGRLRYEIVRELAPYVGIHWSRRSAPGATLSETSFVTGVRLWY